MMAQEIDISSLENNREFITRNKMLITLWSCNLVLCNNSTENKKALSMMMFCAEQYHLKSVNIYQNRISELDYGISS